MTVYLSRAQLLRLHALLVERFGGAAGLRDRGALEAALARPMATFDGEDLLPSLEEKAAALLHSLVVGHPFVDGNKRIGAMAAELFLLVNGSRLVASDAELETLVLAIARGGAEAEAVSIWIRQRLRPLDR